MTPKYASQFVTMPVLGDNRIVDTKIKRAFVAMIQPETKLGQAAQCAVIFENGLSVSVNLTVEEVLQLVERGEENND